MKKIAFAGLLILTASLVFAFTFRSHDSGEIKITVTADQPTTFDLHMFSEGKILKGLTTPYAVTVNQAEGKYILKALDSKSILKMKVESNNTWRLKGEWSLIVLVVDNDKLTTFGID